MTGATPKDSFDAAHRRDWPGYLGSPRLASAAVGEKIWNSFSAAASEHMLKILDGADPATFPRYGDRLRKNPLFQEWITTGEARDRERQQRQQEWLAKRR